MTNTHSAKRSAENLQLVIFMRYVLFAVAAGAINLLSQKIVFCIVPVQPLVVSISAGTAAGFIVKYFLDKHWIFFDGYGDSGQEIRKIAIYASFSVAMTLVFWAFEIAFLVIGGTDAAKYTGAVIGLSIGNFGKYLLDRKFTFNGPISTWR